MNEPKAECKRVEDQPYEELHEEMCKRSLAAEQCHIDSEKKLKCFPESSQPETEEKCLFGKIDKRRQAFIKTNKAGLTKVGSATFAEFIPKPKIKEEVAKREEIKGAIYKFEEFKTPFSESNSTVSGGSTCPPEDS